MFSPTDVAFTTGPSSVAGPLANLAPPSSYYYAGPTLLPAAYSHLDFLTRRMLLRCDSMGDLYPVTAPSHIPHAFLVSQHTWHQRLGHPGGEVLRRLVSSNFISCNKEKPPLPCYACQLEKHVRLPFVSSCTLISSCFDIIHSDVWTSPISSLSANGSTQMEGVNVDETFSLVVKPGTIRIVMSLAASRHWPFHQLDVKNAFLHGDLSETVYMHQPLGFRDYAHPDYVCLLQRSLYGLKQASRAWFQRFASYITRAGFSHSRYLDPLNYFLGISVTRDSSGLFLSQKKYAIEILEKAHIVSCNPSRTRIDNESKLGVDGDPHVCLHMHDPREPHLSALKRILRYIQGTLNYGLQLFSSSTTDLVAYSDADWAGCPTTRRSTSGNFLRELHTPLSSATLVYCDNVSAVYLSSNPVHHHRTKHIKIDIHFVRDLVVAGQVRVLHVPSRYHFANIFTKWLPSSLFEEFRSSLSVRSPPAPIAREC
nr:ribonuclease H-like domain-containing protein [Tanacetum cinerariifolium]